VPELFYDSLLIWVSHKYTLVGCVSNLLKSPDCSGFTVNDNGDPQRDAVQLHVQGGTRPTTPAPATAADRLLMEIRDVLKTMAQRNAGDTDDETKRDWKLAAAVFDRILLVIFSIILVLGMIVFVAIIAAK